MHSLKFCVTLLIILFSTVAIAGETLQATWEIAGLHNPESVVYDPKTKMLYVSNVNGDTNAKDGNGYIAQVSLQGKLIKQRWLEGLDAPKGLAIHADTLYAADIDTLVVIDIPTATVTDRYKVDDAKFLNDVAATSSGDVFVSDMVLNRIHRLSGNAFSIWLESPQLENPNGLLVENDYLILGAWGNMVDGFATPIPGHLKRISIADKSITSMGGAPIGNLDGVESNQAGEYYVTDWMAGKLFRVNKKGQTHLLLELEQGMADLDVVMEQKLILLPMMKTNKLLGYTIQ